MTIDRLRERVEAHIIHGVPNACWKWDASTLPSGRPRIGVRESGRNFSVTAARIIVAARDGLPLYGGPRWVARHTCDNVQCVNPAHIVAGTYRENTADMWDRGRGVRGDRRPSAKLSAEKVREIRRRAAEPRARVAADLGVSPSLIGQVIRGVVWGWVE